MKTPGSGSRPGGKCDERHRYLLAGDVKAGSGVTHRALFVITNDKVRSAGSCRGAAASIQLAGSSGFFG